MAKDKDVKPISSLPKKASPITPSDKFSTPIAVTLDGTILGKGIDSFDSLFAKTMGAVLYGPDGLNVNDLNGLKGLVNKDNNISALLGNISDYTKDFNQNIEELKSSLKINNSEIIKLSKMFSTVYDEAGRIMRCEIIENPNKKKEKSNNEIEVILNSNDIKTVLENIIELSDEQKFITLNNIISQLKEISNIEVNSNLIDFIKNIDEYSKSLLNLKELNNIEINENFINQLSYVEAKNNNINDSIKNINNSFNDVYNEFDKLSKIELSNKTLKILLDTSNINENLDILEKSFENKDMKKLNSLIDSLTNTNKKISEFVGSINSLDFSNIKINESEIERVKGIIDRSSDLFSNYSDLLEFLSDNLKDTLVFDKSTIEILNQIKLSTTLNINDIDKINYILLGLIDIKKSLNELNNINAIDNNKIKGFKDNITLLSELFSIQYNNIGDTDNFIKFLNDNISKYNELNIDTNIKTNISNELSALIKIICDAEESLSDISIENKLNTIINSLSGLDNLKFDDIDKKITGIETIFNKIIDLSKKISEIKIKNKQKISITNFVEICSQLNELTNLGNIDLSDDKINIGDNFINNISLIVNALSQMKSIPNNIDNKMQKVISVIDNLQNTDFNFSEKEKEFKSFTGFVGGEGGLIHAFEFLKNLDVSSVDIDLIIYNIEQLNDLANIINDSSISQETTNTLEGFLSIIDYTNKFNDTVSTRDIIKAIAKTTLFDLVVNQMSYTSKELEAIKFSKNNTKITDLITFIVKDLSPKILEFNDNLIITNNSLLKLSMCNLFIFYLDKLKKSLITFNEGSDKIYDNSKFQDINNAITDIALIGMYLSEYNINLTQEEILDRFNKMKMVLDNLNSFISLYNDIEVIELTRNIPLSSITDILSNLSKISNVIDSFHEISENKIDNIKIFIDKIFGIRESDSLYEYLEELNTKFSENDKKNTILNIKSVCEIIEQIINVGFYAAGFLIISPIALAGIYVLKFFINPLSSVINKLSQIDGKSLENALIVLDDISKILFKMTLTMLIGGLAFALYPKLITGALMFTGIFTVFLFGTMFALSIATKIGNKDNLKAITDINEIIQGATLSLIIGGLFMMIKPLVTGAILFTGLLSFYLFSILATISLASLFVKPKDFENINQLMMYSTGLLIIGGLFMMIKPLVTGAMQFTMLLSFFILSIILTVRAATAWMDKSFATMDKLTTFIQGMVGIMLIGGLFILLMPKVVIAGLLFGAVLSLFIGSILFPFAVFEELLDKSFKGLLQLTIFVAVAGTLLLIAGSIMTPQIASNLLYFTGSLLLLSAAVIGIAWVLDNCEKSIWKAILVMGAITLFIVVGAFAMKEITNTYLLVQAAGGFGSLWLTLINMIGIVALIGVIAYGVSFIAPVLGIGIAVMAGISGFLILTGIAIGIMAKSMQEIEKIKEINFDPIRNNILGLLELGGLFGLLTLSAPLIIPATIAIHGISSAISTISETIAEVSALNIPIYNGKKIIGYRKLNNADFKNAANNTKTIITTLFTPIKKVYEENEQMFNWSLVGSPINRVLKSSEKLGSVISKISDGVKDYADLKIPLYEGTKIVGYRRLEKNDFNNAAKNIKKIILTIGRSLIDIYEENPDMFKSNSISYMKVLTGMDLAKTPMETVISTAGQLGKVIAKISDGLEDYVKLDTKKIESAGKNIKTVIETLSGALIKSYNENPQMYQTGSGGLLGLFTGITLGKSPLEKVISINAQLGKLISKISDGLKDYAELDMKTPNDAAKKIVAVINTLSGALMSSYTSNTALYTDNSLFGNLIGGNASKTPYGMVIATNTKLGQLISKLADGVADMANLKIATSWNSDGKATKYRQLNENDFTAAGTNVGIIISTLGEALMKEYNKHTDWYDDKSLFGNIIGQDASNSKFTRILSINMKMAKLVSSISNSVKNIAKMRIPTKWDNNGNAIEFENLNENHFTTAATGISKIISTIGGAIIKVASEHKDWFEDGEDSEFSQIMISIGGMGNLVKDLSEGIKNYAELKIPEYDAAGKITGYKQLIEQDFIDAGTNIGIIVTSLSSALVKAFDNKDMKAMIKGGNESKLNQIISSVQSIGEIISSISEGISLYAGMKIPSKWDKKGNPIEYKSIDIDSQIASLETNLPKILTALITSVNNVYNQNTTLFTGEQPIIDNVISSVINMADMLTTVATSVEFFANLDGKKLPNGRIFKISEIDKLFENTNGPIFKILTGLPKAVANASKELDTILLKTGGKERLTLVISSVSDMGDMLSNLASGISDFIDDVSSKKIDVETLKDPINTIITGLASTINEAYTGKEKLFDIDDDSSPVKRVITGTKEMISIIAPIGRVIKDYAEMNVPESIEQGASTIKIDESYINKAMGLVSTVIKSLAVAINEAYINNETIFDDDDILNNMTKFNKIVIDAIGFTTQFVKEYANLNVPIEFDSNGNPTKYKKLEQSDFDTASSMVTSVFETIGGAIKKVTTGGNYAMYNTNKIQSLVSNIKVAVKGVSETAEYLSMFANNKFINPLNPEKTIKLTQDQMESAAGTVKKVLTTISEAIEIASNDIMGGTNDSTIGGFFSESSDQRTNKINKMYKLIKDAITLVTSVGSSLAIISKGKLPEIDNKGNVKEGTSINTDTSKITAIFTAFSNIIGDLNTKFGKDNERVKSFNKTKKNIEPIIETVNNIQEFLLEVFSNKSKLSQIDSTILGDPISNIQKGIIALANIFVSENGKDTGIKTTIENNINSIETILDNFEDKIVDELDFIDDFTKQSNKLGVAIQLFKNKLIDFNGIQTILPLIKISEINGLLVNFSNIGKSVDLSDTTVKLEDIAFTSVQTKLESLSSIINDNLLKLSNNLSRINFDLSKEQNISSLLTTTGEIFNLIENIVKSTLQKGDKQKITDNFAILNTLSSEISNIKFVDTTNLSNLEGSLTSLVSINTMISNLNNSNISLDNYINNLTNNIINRIQEIKLEEAVSKSKTINEQLNNIYNNLSVKPENNTVISAFGTNLNSPIVSLVIDLTNLVDFSKKVNDNVISNIDSLNNGISESYKVILDAPEEKHRENFRNHISDIKDYVSVINSIDVSSINSLTEMVNALLKLGLNMGNMDKLTEAIAEKLSVSLTNITNAINEFNTTYKNEVNVRDKRKEEIDRSLNKVKNMFDNELKVKVEKIENKSKSSARQFTDKNNDGKDDETHMTKEKYQQTVESILTKPNSGAN